MASIKRVRFLQTRIVKDGSGQRFEEGVEYDLPVTSAERWIRRSLAVEVVAADPVPETTTVVEDVKAEPHSPPYEAKHAGRGNFNVIDANGVKVNEGAMTKDEAAAFAESLNELSQSVDQE